MMTGTLNHTDDYIILELIGEQRRVFPLLTARDGAHPADDMPHLTTSGGRVHWTFTDEIHQWFVDRNIPYELGGYKIPGTYNYCYQISFENKSQAALFKLTFA